MIIWHKWPEEKPSEDGKYLCCDVDGWIFLAQYDDFANAIGSYDNVWVSDSGNQCMTDIFWWSELNLPGKT